MNIYKRQRFPPDIISYAVWLYHRFNLSHRDIEELLAERRISVSHESIRLWCIKFGPVFAKRLRRKHHGGAPRKIVTDQLGSYRVAHRAWAPDSYPVTDRYANNRAEQSHEATRFRERGIRRFKSTGVHSAVYNLFNLSRHMVRARDYRDLRHRAFVFWIQVTAG